MLSRLINRTDERTEGSSLAIVRIVFGAVGVLSVVRIVGYGWVETLYAGPSRRFSYPGSDGSRHPVSPARMSFSPSWVSRRWP
jgi:hypothetical protein